MWWSVSQNCSSWAATVLIDSSLSVPEVLSSPRELACLGMSMSVVSGICELRVTLQQGVVTYAPPVEAFATGIKIGSNDQRYFSDRSSDHSHFHERSRIKKGSNLIKARRDVTTRQRTRARTRAYRISIYRDFPGYRY